MDYERIHKVQMGIISPSKLRMKLLGSQHMRRKDGRSSSRASPSKHDDSEYAKRNLLCGDLREEADSMDSSIDSSNPNHLNHLFSSKDISSFAERNQSLSSTGDSLFQESFNARNIRNHNNTDSSSQNLLGSKFNAVNSIKHQEEDSNDYDSGHENASTSSFEFHRGEKTSQHPVIGAFSGHVPSKWNDAEKWLVNRQAMNSNASKKTSSQNHGNRLMISSWARIAPESMIADHRPSVIQSAARNPISHYVPSKFSFVPLILHSSLVSSKDSSILAEHCQGSSDSDGLARLKMERNHNESSVTESCLSQMEDIPAKSSVSMRDVGTEMTPIASQDPSRTGTPIEHMTPRCSPVSSTQSSPRKRLAAVDMSQSTSDNVRGSHEDSNKLDLSDREVQLKTRREIAALGLQLGKLNIASWAIREETEPTSLSPKAIDEVEQLRKEYEARAASWEEAEKSKHMARFKREEIKIQAWEIHQRAKYEARMRKVEIQAENMKSRGEEAMSEKLRRMLERAEEKRAAAEATKNCDAARTARQAERIRKTGRAPSPRHTRCCSWFL
ncbi:Remorin [Apostasia shenzhenica]|uniref:Remorin n=1 Tax=Apostasia shenzhenica TaxID=1088818 RepID=A0A2I0B2I1_9ASPA|nr:Remorin [Apostasia shenzhenica]